MQLESNSTIQIVKCILIILKDSKNKSFSRLVITSAETAHLQKQLFKKVSKKSVPEKMMPFTGKHLCRNLFLIKLQVLNFAKKYSKQGRIQNFHKVFQMGRFAVIFNDLQQVIILAEPSTLDICGTPGYISEK